MNKTIWETLIRGDVQVGGDPGGSPTGSSYKVGEKLDRDAIMTCKGRIKCGFRDVEGARGVESLRAAMMLSSTRLSST